MIHPVYQAGPTGIAFSLPSVLVVNDHAPHCTQLRQTLSQLGVAEVYCAANGHEAMRTLSRLEAPPELVICDMLMPEMDGIEMIGQLNRQRYAGALILLCEDVSPGLIAIARDLVDFGHMQLLGTYARLPSAQDLTEVMSIHSGVRQAMIQRAGRFVSSAPWARQTGAT